MNMFVGGGYFVPHTIGGLWAREEVYGSRMETLEICTSGMLRRNNILCNFWHETSLCVTAPLSVRRSSEELGLTGLRTGIIPMWEGINRSLASFDWNYSLGPFKNASFGFWCLIHHKAVERVHRVVAYHTTYIPTYLLSTTSTSKYGTTYIKPLEHVR